MVRTKSGRKVEILFGTGVSSEKDYASLLPLIRTAIEEGIAGFDTAPSYGTEEVLGRCIGRCMEELHMDRSELYIQTKLDAVQMADGRDVIPGHVRDTMQKMGVDYFDAILIHWPVPEYLQETWDCLAELQACSPLCKMHREVADSGKLAGIAAHHHKNVGQVVMRWHLDTGAVPIFTSKKESRIREYANLGDFALTEREIEAVNSLNRDYKMYLESMACPGF